MKKLIILVIACILGIGAHAQSTTGYYYQKDGGEGDTLGSVTTTWSQAINFQVPQACYYNDAVKVTNDGSFACTIKLQGKIHDTDTYTDITTVTYTGVGADTTAKFTQTSTAQFYRYYNVLITRTAGVGSVNFVKESLKY